MATMKEFLDLADLEITVSEDNEIKGIGLKWGESKMLANYGIPRKQQIKFLDKLRDNPKLLKGSIPKNWYNEIVGENEDKTKNYWYQLKSKPKTKKNVKKVS